ncbi:uncharacterized protein LOC113763447 isoform X2 [Coffea eugenioides]|uniref:uncharacterized protein LOC113763447 isoform X2 n=1 Tax=Coffea eugenioides TaxID=49369 RepID=UPI000F605B78|nr:uncharacterized protein LOC113763447 isoform X2 [Coffea eugenioides]
MSTINGKLYAKHVGFDVYQSQQWASGNKSELELYLDERLVDRKQQPDLNVLTYWKESRIRYPELSLMARDILSIPITTVASEYALVMVGEFLKNFELLCCWIIWRHYCVLEIGCIIVKEDDEQDLGIDISRLLLNKMHLQMLILSFVIQHMEDFVSQRMTYLNLAQMFQYMSICYITGVECCPSAIKQISFSFEF